MKTGLAISILAAAALLAACGGGDDNNSPTTTGGGTTTGGTTTGGTTTGGTTTGGTATPDAADKYVGTWAFCFTGTGTSRREAYVFNKLDATRFTIATTETDYGNSNCSGAGQTTTNASGTVTISGTKTTSSNETADKLDLTFTACTGGDCPAKLPFTTKWIGTGTGTQVRIGFDVDLDANGYPGRFQDAFAKQ